MKQFNRIRISNSATIRLRTLKGKTGLTPNILARIALCYSLNNEKISNLKKYQIILEFDRVLGLNLDLIQLEKLPREIEELITQREDARFKKDWKKSDQIRDKLLKKGYIVEDTASGPRWKKK